ncbi:MAG TPA: Asp-tRNA(Asn)/Glu-tRNA(Gln) amidotransferase GatCAB subunit B, partial [Candidatus Ratteibacteria bacterium]|nr:Asp-tRNA(Asn)/Glu-tRNA(Gln) amidotransferase GatCAB subunit B [Candidatus Ratteibacteria bacterium]
IKNMNSFKAVRKALSYEEKRQISILNRGGKIQQETRLWNDKLQKTEIMRTKEEAHDYRYFPEPDLLPVEIDDEFINKVKEEIGQLPDDRKERIKLKYGLPIYDIDVLMSEKIIIDYFEECSEIFKNYKLISNWIMGEIMSLLKGKEIKFLFEKIPPEKFIDLLKMVEEGKITSTVGKNVLKEILKTGKFPSEIVKEKGLLQIGDEEFIENIVKQVIDENQKAVDDYKKGKEKVMGFLIGQVMKKTKGKVNSEIVEKTIKKLI